MIKIKEEFNENFLIENDIESAFLKGNLWPRLYDKFKYEAKKLEINNDFDNTVYMLEIYNFLSMELAIYLCNYPNDKKANELLLRANSERSKLIEYISSQYSGLTQYCKNNTNYFKLDMPWSDKNV